jgi:hypothetical protein
MSCAGHGADGSSETGVKIKYKSDKKGGEVVKHPVPSSVPLHTSGRGKFFELGRMVKLKELELLR